MYVCICNAITERELRKAAKDGTRCVQTLYARMGVEPKCGSCLEYAVDLLAEEPGQQGWAWAPRPAGAPA